MVTRVLLDIVILILAIPVGFLLAWLARDELVSGRKWFRRIIISALIIGGWFYLIDEKTVALTCLFIIIVTYVSYIKSFDKRWAKQRFK